MDNKIKAIDALTSMANSAANKRSNAAKLREIFCHIERALSSGVSRKAVLKTICDTLDITMSMKDFDKNLYRIRKKRKTLNPTEQPKPDEKNNTGPQTLLVAHPNTTPTTRLEAIPTRQNELAIIYEEDVDDDGLQTASQPHDLKAVWAIKHDMIELRARGKELNKTKKQAEKNEGNRN